MQNTEHDEKDFIQAPSDEFIIVCDFNNEPVGQLKVVEGKLSFTGDFDQSAQIFAKALVEAFNEHMGRQNKI